MDYQLILLILGIIVFTGGFMWLSKYLKTKGYTMDDMDNSLNISKLVLRFVKVTLSRKLNDTYKVIYHTDLIIEAIDYLQTLSADISIDEKVDKAMSKIYDVSDKLYIKLNDEERVIVREVLITAYDMYVSLYREKEEYRIRQL